MNILAIDTSGFSMSICIKKDEKVLGEMDIDNGLVHSKQFMPSIEELFKKLDMDKKNLDMVATTIGPGSFTGIRIAVATGNALSIALNIPIIDIVSLDALAMNMRYFDGYIIPAIDAQKGNYYTSIYTNEKKLVKTRDYEVKSYQEIFNFVEKSDKKCVILGDIIRDLELPEKVLRVPDEYNNIRASNVAILAEEKYNQKDIKKFASPFYMRKSQAEVQYEEKQLKNKKNKEN